MDLKSFIEKYNLEIKITIIDIRGVEHCAFSLNNVEFPNPQGVNEVVYGLGPTIELAVNDLIAKVSEYTHITLPHIVSGVRCTLPLPKFDPFQINMPATCVS